MFISIVLVNRIKSMVGSRKLFRWILIIFGGLFLFPALPQDGIYAQELIDTTDEKSKVKFVISAVDDKEKQPKVSFKVGEKIIIEAVITNDSDKIYPHTVINLYYHYQFNLQKVGKRSVEKYRESKIKSISAGEREPTSFARLEGLPIKPGESRLIAKLELDNWYEDVEPGEYRLTIQYRSNPGKPVLLSNMLIIAIVP